MVVPWLSRISKAPKIRKHLAADPIFAKLKSRFARIPDHRDKKATIPLADALQSAFAMFALKDPSLLAFDKRRSDANMHAVFNIGQIPSDTQMREILDEVDPDELRPAFDDVIRDLQRGKVLESYAFHEGAYLLSLDGTGYFSSQKVKCKHCQEKVDKKTKKVTYQHQLLAAVIVHPDHREVFPLAPEPILKQDGITKNDCERMAAKRLLEKIRAVRPHMKFIVVEDGLASNAPHVRLLKDLSMNFILGVKSGDHEHLFGQVHDAYEQELMTIQSWQEGDVHCTLSYVNSLELNASNQDLRVNFLEYTEHNAKGELLKHFSWVTDLPLNRDNARKIMRGGRARWKIENETFNTLKNQGYHFEHNFGHGEKHLSSVMALLMMLAFLVDQAQQHCCPLFKAVLKKLKSKNALWDNLRSHFRHFVFLSMQHLYEAILYDLGKEVPLPTFSSA